MMMVMAMVPAMMLVMRMLLIQPGILYNGITAPGRDWRKSTLPKSGHRKRKNQQKAE
jgi:hypothetical protein